MDVRQPLTLAAVVGDAERHGRERNRVSLRVHTRGGDVAVRRVDAGQSSSSRNRLSGVRFS